MKHVVTLTISNPSHEHLALRRSQKTTNYIVEARDEAEAIFRASNHFRKLGNYVHEAKVAKPLTEETVSEDVEQVNEFLGVLGAAGRAAAATRAAATASKAISKAASAPVRTLPAPVKTTPAPVRTMPAPVRTMPAPAPVRTTPSVPVKAPTTVQPVTAPTTPVTGPVGEEEPVVLPTDPVTSPVTGPVVVSPVGGPPATGTRPVPPAGLPDWSLSGGLEDSGFLRWIRAGRALSARQEMHEESHTEDKGDARKNAVTRVLEKRMKTKKEEMRGDKNKINMEPTLRTRGGMHNVKV